MATLASRFHFASAPDSWGVLDYPGPSWNQSYEKMLDEMVAAGYTGSELGPYGFFPTDPKVLKPQLEKRKLKLLGSFVPVVLSDPAPARSLSMRSRNSFGRYRGNRGDLMAKLGVGVLGVGEMGKRHAENLRRLVPEAHLVAVADVAADRARQVAAELEIERSFASLDDMLACKDIQAVLIATPDKFHAQGVRSAAVAGKDILCEKPLALNLADAHAALDAVAKAGVRLQIGFMRHYDPAYVAAMKRIEAGEIGDPVVFKSVGRDRDMPPIAAYQSGVNGMLFYNNTIHDFDLARWMVR